MAQPMVAELSVKKSGAVQVVMTSQTWKVDVVSCAGSCWRWWQGTSTLSMVAFGEGWMC